MFFSNISYDLRDNLTKDKALLAELPWCPVHERTYLRVSTACSSWEHVVAQTAVAAARWAGCWHTSPRWRSVPTRAPEPYCNPPPAQEIKP